MPRSLSNRSICVTLILVASLLVGLEAYSLAGIVRGNLAVISLNRGLTATDSDISSRSFDQAFWLLNQNLKRNTTQRNQILYWRALAYEAINRNDISGAVSSGRSIPGFDQTAILHAVAASESGDKDMALRWAHIATQIDLLNTLDRANEIFWKWQEYRLAADLWREAIDTYGDNPDLLLWYRGEARSRYAAGEREEAADSATKGLLLFPDDAELLLKLGQASLAIDGNEQVALERFLRAIELDPTLADSYVAAARIQLSQEDYRTAEENFARALQLDPKNVTWMVSRANVLRTMEEYARAHELYSEAISLNPHYSRAYFELAGLYRKTGSIDEAISAIEQAIQTMYKPDYRYYLVAGGLYESIGRLDNAIDAYQESLAIEPNNSQATEALQRLNK